MFKKTVILNIFTLAIYTFDIILTNTQVEIKQQLDGSMNFILAGRIPVNEHLLYILFHAEG